MPKKVSSIWGGSSANLGLKDCIQLGEVMIRTLTHPRSLSISFSFFRDYD